MKNHRLRLESKRLGYLLTIPATVLIILICIYPLMQGIGLSFQNYNLQKPQSRSFIGLGNYIKLITEDKEFHGALSYTFIYTFFVVILSYFVGLNLALLLKRDMPGRGIYRALALLPWVIAPSVAAVNWSLLLNDRIGLVNNFLQLIGAIEKPILFLAKGNIARLTVIFTDLWRDFPFMMIVILAALQSIPNELYEAAYIDGAGFWKSFAYITIPMIKKVSAIATILMFIWVFNHFDNIYLLTNGGPAGATFTLPILTYYTAFYRGNIGYASAIATVMLCVLLIIAVFYLKVTKAFNKE